MIKMSRQVDYGLQLIFSLSKGKNKPVSLHMVSRESTISFLFLQKIAKLLREAGLIVAVKGPRGGYLLARPMEDISLKDVMEAIEGGYSVAACTAQGGHCDKEGQCTLKKGVEKMQADMMHYMSSLKVADLISSVS